MNINGYCIIDKSQPTSPQKPITKNQTRWPWLRKNWGIQTKHNSLTKPPWTPSPQNPPFPIFPPPPAKNQEGRKPINIKKDQKKVWKTLQIPWKKSPKKCPILSPPVRGNTLHLLAMIHFGLISHWVKGNTLITLLFFVGWLPHAEGQNCWGSRRWVPESLVRQDHLTG